MVGEHSYSIEAGAARPGGGIRRENVGMSNHYPNEKLEPRKSKVSVALAINHGLGGPKAMAKAAADGKLVNIPALPNFFEAATREIRRRALLVLHRLSQSASWRRGPAEGSVFTGLTPSKSPPRKTAKS